MPTAESRAFQEFFDVVVKDPSLLERLRAAPDAEALAVLAVGLGRERGLLFDTAEVAGRMCDARRGWNERWLR